MKTKRIETYSLFEFCQAVQESVIEGWRFDFESNELFPTAFGSMLVTGMVKGEAEVIALEDNIIVQDNKSNEVLEDNIQVKRGRKSKDNI